MGAAAPARVGPPHGADCEHVPGRQPASRRSERLTRSRLRQATRTRSALQGGLSDGPGGHKGARRWNVLAEELIEYPPAHRRIFLEDSWDAGACRPARSGSDSPESSAERWLEQERARLKERALRGLDPPRPAAVVEAVPGEPRPRRPRSEVAHSSTRQTNRR
ncbi:MAG: hypothetical protein ACRDZ5_00880, partial [Acidimicrobiales bacterium]